MNHITHFNHEKRNVPLTIPTGTDENTYTVIVGKNGVGKSRLLTSMVREYTTITRYPDEVNLLDVHYIEEEPKVIAVSTSPFDKFQLPPKIRVNKSSVNTNYRYIGMRSGGPYGTSPISLISSATVGILERYLKNENYDRLLDVFHTLGFTPEIQLIFKANFKLKRYMRFDDEQDRRPVSPQIEWIESLGIETTPKVTESLLGLNDSEMDKVGSAIKSLYEVFQYEKAISIGLDFSNGEIFSLNRESNNNVSILDSLNILLKLNIIRLMDLKLHKFEYGPMSLRRASSGEQCMLVIMLGIAGHINDNSLVFIDEPEISLHPKWQEDFITLLMRTFSKYRACQFFIATHSPQIISKLSDENCFVTSLSKNELFTPSFFRNKSSDFQLAELFDAPGTRNEYISRLAFKLLSKVKRNKSVDSTDHFDLNKLMSMNEMIDRDDPTFDLILSVKEVVEFYASN